MTAIRGLLIMLCLTACTEPKSLSKSLKPFCEVQAYKDDFWGLYHTYDAPLDKTISVGLRTKEEAEAWCKLELTPQDTSEPKTLETTYGK